MEPEIRDSIAPHTTNIVVPKDKYKNFFLKTPTACLALIKKPIPSRMNPESKNTTIRMNVG